MGKSEIESRIRDSQEWQDFESILHPPAPPSESFIPRTDCHSDFTTQNRPCALSFPNLYCLKCPIWLFYSASVLKPVFIAGRNRLFSFLGMVQSRVTHLTILDAANIIVKFL